MLVIPLCPSILSHSDSKGAFALHSIPEIRDFSPKVYRLVLTELTSPLCYMCSIRRPGPQYYIRITMCLSVCLVFHDEATVKFCGPQF
jgi:hypothetical protein